MVSWSLRSPRSSTPRLISGAVAVCCCTSSAGLGMLAPTKRPLGSSRCGSGTHLNWSWTIMQNIWPSWAPSIKSSTCAPGISPHAHRSEGDKLPCQLWFPHALNPQVPSLLLKIILSLICYSDSSSSSDAASRVTLIPPHSPQGVIWAHAFSPNPSPTWKPWLTLWRATNSSSCNTWC